MACRYACFVRRTCLQGTSSWIHPGLLTAAAAPRWQSTLQASSGDAEEHWPVIISGAGPSGLILSTLLSKLGVRSLVLDRASSLSVHPRAHFINNRTMEIFRPLSGLAEAVSSKGPPLAHWRKFVYCESMTGAILGEVDHFQGAESAQNRHLSPEPVAHLAQNQLLPLLLERASVAAESSGGAVRLGQEVLGLSQTPSGCTVEVQSAKGRSQLSCDYLVGADGAASRVRTLLGVKMEGQAAMQHLINIHFQAPGLWRLLKDRPGMLYFVFNQDVILVLVAHDLEKGELVAQVPYFPPLQTPAEFTPEVCTRLLKKAIGAEEVGIDLKAIHPWTMDALVAESYQVGRVFLVGDAAHRFPPAGGFGMNTGIQDAHNLAWKLAAVLNKATSARLLDSYQAERKPIAQANTALSVANFKEAIRVPEALGLDPRAAAVLNTAVTSGPLSLLPGGAQSAIFRAGLATGLAASGLRGPLGGWRRRQLDQIFASGASLRLQFPREDIGFVYQSPGAAIVQELTSGGSRPEEKVARDAPYFQSTRPGGRLPHAEIHWLAEGRKLEPVVSTLDLVPYEDCGLRLLLGGSEAAFLWAAAAQKLALEKGLNIGVVHIVSNSGCLNPKGEAASGSNISFALDSLGDWGRLRGVSEDGVVAVRPDGHVAWRTNDAPSNFESAVRALDAVAQALFPQS